MNFYVANPQNRTHLQMQVQRQILYHSSFNNNRQQQENKKLVQNVHNMKPSIQNAPPKQYRQVSNKSKTIGRRKQSSQEQFKTNEAKRENQILLTKMLMIMQRNPKTGQPTQQHSSNSSMTMSLPPKSIRNRPGRFGSSQVVTQDYKQNNSQITPQNMNVSKNNGQSSQDKLVNSSFTGLSGLFVKQKKYSVEPRRASKKRGTTGEVTMFKISNARNNGKSLSHQGSAKRLKNSTISQHSQNSNRSNSSQASRRSLNYDKRKKELDQISKDNLRFVANLVNVKPTVTVTSSKKYQDELNAQKALRQSLSKIRYGTPTHDSSRSKKHDFNLRLNNHDPFQKITQQYFGAQTDLNNQKRGLSTMAKLFSVGDDAKNVRQGRVRQGSFVSRPDSRTSKRSRSQSSTKSNKSKKQRRKRREMGFNFADPLMSETGGDFTENNSVNNYTQKSRLKNTAPIRNMNALVDQNFLSETTSGNILEPSETASHSLIANKNRMMAQQVQMLTQQNSFQRDYIQEPYTEIENSTICEDGQTLTSPLRLQKNKNKSLAKKLRRSQDGRSKSDNKRHQSNFNDKRIVTNSYFSHVQANGNSIGYDAFIKCKKDYEREFYMKQNQGIRGIKTAGSVRPPLASYDKTFASYQTKNLGNFRSKQNMTMHTVSRRSQNSMSNNKRRIIIANDKQPASTKSVTGSRMADYVATEHQISHHYKQQYVDQTVKEPNPKKFVKDYIHKNPAHHSQAKIQQDSESATLPSVLQGTMMPRVTHTAEGGRRVRKTDTNLPSANPNNTILGRISSQKRMLDESSANGGPIQVQNQEAFAERWFNNPSQQHSHINSHSAYSIGFATEALRSCKNEETIGSQVVQEAAAEQNQSPPISPKIINRPEAHTVYENVQFLKEKNPEANKESLQMKMEENTDMEISSPPLQQQDQLSNTSTPVQDTSPKFAQVQFPSSYPKLI